MGKRKKSKPVRGYPWKRRAFALLLGGAALGGAYWFHGNPAATETFYGASIGPWIASHLSRWTGALPFSVAEIVLGLFVLRQLLGCFKGWRAVKKKAIGVSRLLLSGLFRLAADAGLVVALFYGLWGYHYYRPPVAERLDWQGEAVASEEVVRLARTSIDLTNDAYLTLHGKDDIGRPTQAPATTVFLEEAIHDGYVRVSSWLGEPKDIFREFGRAKPLVLSPVLHYLGLSGFYFPWTGEAGFNRTVPGVGLPHVLAHEKAHQRGFAPEDEANFFGFLACVKSRDPLTRYSGHVFAQQQLLSVVAKEDMKRYMALIEHRLPGVARDIEDQRTYWRRYEDRGPEVARKIHRAAKDAATTVNDAYLKSQSVEEGVKSYSTSVRLLIEYFLRLNPTHP